MPSRTIHPAADDGHHGTVPSRAQTLRHFRRVIENAWALPSPDTALAKRRLDYFCGHIDEARGLKDFVHVPAVAAHFTALNPDVRVDVTGFRSALALYLSLLSAEIRGDGGFRGASVALTFDRARFDMNMGRFDQDEAALAFRMRREKSIGPTR